MLQVLIFSDRGGGAGVKKGENQGADHTFFGVSGRVSGDLQGKTTQMTIVECVMQF